MPKEKDTKEVNITHAKAIFFYKGMAANGYKESAHMKDSVIELHDWGARIVSRKNGRALRVWGSNILVAEEIVE